MSTIEDFENAPVGAIATHEATGIRAFKTEDQNLPWTNSQDNYLTHADMADEGYTLDPEAPTTVREALNLAWELAHPVKEGQHIPECTPYLMKDASGLREYTQRHDFEIIPELMPIFRTLEPLPVPDPDWLDAPAVLARLDSWGDDERVVFVPASTDNRWVTGTGATFHWNELRDVTPLS